MSRGFRVPAPCVIVLQARTSSSRLPAKVLLPVGGMPLAVLAARRASTTGREVIVATSNDPDDDDLAAVVQAHGLRVHRGSLDNVLHRVVGAVAGFPDDTLFVRLTADNVFPDGTLIDEVADDFIARDAEYMLCNGVYSGLPYGVSCEVTRIRHLREAARHATIESDLEHVTPYVARNVGVSYFEKYVTLRKGHYRCTVDSYDDYTTIRRVFADIDDPIGASTFELIDRLPATPYQPSSNQPVPGLVVGTAQLGLPYGIANASGMPAASESKRLLKTAIANGAQWIDTARGYGQSEARIGAALADGWQERVRIATKLAPLDDCGPDAAAETVRARVDASVFESCMRLRVQKLDTIMLHRAAHIHAWNGAVWQRLLELKERGIIGTVGASVQSPAELLTSLREPQVGIIQLPFNLLDWRWDRCRDAIRERKAAGALIVHARSALLQGLLTTRDTAAWQKAHVDTPEVIFDWLGSMCQALGCSDVIDLCLRYVRSQDWIDGVVVGMETVDQVTCNVARFARPGLVKSDSATLELTRPYVEARTLDPSQWLNDAQAGT